VSGQQDGRSESAEPDAEATGPSTDDGEPTPQPEALRRQQRLVGVVGGVVAGLAAAASVAQRFPDLPLVVALLVGLVAAVGVFRLAAGSIFPGEGDAD